LQKAELVQISLSKACPHRLADYRGNEVADGPFKVSELITSRVNKAADWSAISYRTSWINLIGGMALIIFDWTFVKGGLVQLV